MDSLGIAASSLGKVHFRQNPHQMDSFMYPGETVTIPLPPELTQLLNKQKSSPIHQPAGIFHLQLIEANRIMQPGTSTMLTGKEAIQSFGWVLCRNRLPPPPKETPTWSILQNQILLWSLLRCCCVVGMLPRLSPDQPILGCRALDLQLCAPSGWMLTLQCPQVLMP